MSTANLEKLRLELNPSELDAPDGGRREYDIYPLQRVDPTQRKNATSIALPGQAPTSNIFLGISGMEQDITIDFFLYDDGTDRANGTHTSTVVTVEEQLTYLRDTIHEPAFAAAWQLDHLTGGVYANRDVFLEEFSAAPIDVDSPLWKSARLVLRVGESIG